MKRTIIFKFCNSNFMNGITRFLQGDKLLQNIHLKICKHKSPLLALEITNLFR